MEYDLQGGRKMSFVITVPVVHLVYDKALIRKILVQGGREIIAKAKSLIGKKVRKGKRHVTSVAGQPPNSLSGMLAKSLKVKIRRDGDRVSIFDAIYYSKFLEVGATGGGGPKGSKNLKRSHRRGAGPGIPVTNRKMLPHPFLSTAANDVMPNLSRQIKEALAKGIDLKVLKAQS
jgi:hypothetical protein